VPDSTSLPFVSSLSRRSSPAGRHRQASRSGSQWGLAWLGRTSGIALGGTPRRGSVERLESTGQDRLSGPSAPAARD